MMFNVRGKETLKYMILFYISNLHVTLTLQNKFSKHKMISYQVVKPTCHTQIYFLDKTVNQIMLLKVLSSLPRKQQKKLMSLPSMGPN